VPIYTVPIFPSVLKVQAPPPGLRMRWGKHKMSEDTVPAHHPASHICIVRTRCLGHG
jgi:hypothetical protein